MIIKPEMSLKPLLLRRTDPPLSCTTLHLAFIMKALVWQQSWFPPERVTHKNIKYDYDTPFCRRIYYLADQFNSKKKIKICTSLKVLLDAVTFCIPFMRIKTCTVVLRGAPLCLCQRTPDTAGHKANL